VSTTAEAGFFSNRNRLFAGATAGIVLAAVTTIGGAAKGLGAEKPLVCDVSSLVFQGFERNGQTFGEFMGNSNCRRVADSISAENAPIVCKTDIKADTCTDGLSRGNNRDKTWYRWDIDVNGRDIVRKGGPVTQVRLPGENAKITATYTTGYGNVTSTRVQFKPGPHYPEADLIVGPETPVVFTPAPEAPGN
jgi:hypothetical protein